MSISIYPLLFLVVSILTTALLTKFVACGPAQPKDEGPSNRESLSLLKNFMPKDPATIDEKLKTFKETLDASQANWSKREAMVKDFRSNLGAFNEKLVHLNQEITNQIKLKENSKN